MKEIGREFPFIKDVLSSQVALVFRELDQALTDYISAFIPFQVRHEICQQMCQEGTSREYFSSRNKEWEIFKLIRTTDLILVEAPKWLDQAQALPVRHSLW